jgi:hypothetical protein
MPNGKERHGEYGHECYLHGSSVYDIRTSKSKEDQEKYGNAKFQLTVNTHSFPTTAAVVPDVITMPNLFANVNRYRNEVMLAIGQSRSPTSLYSFAKTPFMKYIFPVGNYSENQFVNATTHIQDSTFHPLLRMYFGYNYSTQRIDFALNRSYFALFQPDPNTEYAFMDPVLIAPLEWWEMVGFDVRSTPGMHPYENSAFQRSVAAAPFTNDWVFSWDHDTYGVPLDFSDADSQPYYLLDFREHITQTTTDVSQYYNDYSTVRITAPLRPNFKGEKMVYMSASELGSTKGRMMTSGGTTTNNIVCIPLQDTYYGNQITVNNQDMDLALFHTSDRSHNTNLFEIKDVKQRTLYLPPNQHVHFNFKLIHG